MEEEKYISGNLRNLIRSCCLDIDGKTSREQIKNFLPIDQNFIKVWLEEDKMFFLIEQNISFFILERDGYFNNIDILKRLMFRFDIFLGGDKLFDRNIFQNNILKLLTK